MFQQVDQGCVGSGAVPCVMCSQQCCVVLAPWASSLGNRLTDDEPLGQDQMFSLALGSGSGLMWTDEA